MGERLLARGEADRGSRSAGLSGLTHDLRVAARLAWRSRAWSLAVVLTLALGIGMNTAVFAALRAILFSPLPFPDASRLVVLDQRTRDGGGLGLSPVEIRDWQQRSRSLLATAEFHGWSFNAVVGDRPHRLRAGVVSAAFFDVLGVSPALGRTFTAQEDSKGAPPVAVVSSSFWRGALGGDPAVVGRTFVMNGAVHRILGVLPELPPFPEACDVLIPTSASPYRSRPAWERRTSRVVTALGRLAPDVTPSQAEAELAGVTAELAKEFPGAYPAGGSRPRVTPAYRAMTAEARTPLVLLQVLALLVLVAATANVGAMSLARLARRQRELATRAVLGAGASRIARQLVAESALLATAAGALGVLLAVACLGLVTRVASALTPRASEITLGLDVVLLGLAVSITCGVLVGALQALTVRLVGTAHSLAGSTRAVAGPARGRLLNGLVAAQLMAAVVLVYCAALTARSLANLVRVDPGYEQDGVLTVRLDLDWSTYVIPGEGVPGLRRDAVRRLYEQVREEVSRCPGVVNAALVSELPLGREGLVPVVVDGEEGTSPASRAALLTASPELFGVLRIPTLDGRVFDGRETGDRPTVAVVSSSFAARQLGERSPVGRRISLDGGRSWLAVVGVVGDVRYGSLAAEPAPQVYLSSAQNPQLGAWLVARVDRDPLSLASRAAAAVATVDPHQPITEIATLVSRQRQALASWTLASTLLVLLAGIAGAIAAAGIAGALACTTSQRLGEFGLRLALGATRQGIYTLALRQVAVLGAAALAVGVPASLLAGHALRVWLYGVGPHDPATLALTAAFMTAVLALASFAPAHRAAATDPAQLLRTL